MPTSTVENYLKAILHLSAAAADHESLAPLGQLAARLGVTAGTATSMVKRLADEGLASYEPRRGVKLTERGEKLALRVLRRHRLVELFLVDVMRLNWSEVNAEAEVLEHAISDRLLDRIDEMLGHPSHDPHGDPIPTAKGELPSRELTTLEQSPAGPVRVARVTDQSAAFLRYVEREGLNPGARLVVRGRDALAETITVSLADGGEKHLGLGAAAKLLVAPLDGRGPGS